MLSAMILRWVLTLFALLGITASAAMTAGWKVPVGYLYPDFSQSPLARKLDRPPGESPYFEPGDPLWEISRCLYWQRDSATAEPASPWTGEWIVWNARSGLVVARGARNEIAAVDRVLDLASANLIASTRVEVIRHGAARPLDSLTLTSRSSEPATFQSAALELETTSTIENAALATTCLKVKWHDPDAGLEWRLETFAPLPDRQRTLVAKHGDLEFWATVEFQLFGGTPRLTCRTRESAGQILNDPFPASSTQPELEDLGNGLAAAWCRADLSSDTDPFAPSSPAETPTRLEIPASLKTLAHGNFFTLSGDARTRVDRIIADEKGTLDLTGFFAAEDELSGLILFSGKKATVDRLAAGFTGPPPEPSPLEVRIEAGAGPDAWVLLGRPGETSRLSGSRGGSIEHLFEIKPGLPHGPGELQLDCTLDTAGSHLSASLSLQPGQPAELGKMKSGDGRETPVQVTAHWEEAGE